MKRIVTGIAVALVAASTFAGVTYDFRSETTGIQNVTLDGSVATDGLHVRMMVSNGDGLILRSGSVVLSNDGGKNLKVFDSAAKTYYEIPLDQMFGSGPTGMLNNGMFKLSFESPTI